MDAGIVIHFLQRQIMQNHAFSDQISSGFYRIPFILKTYFLFTGVSRYMKHIPDQDQDPLNQEVILFLSLLPVLKGKMEGEKMKYNA